MFPRLAGGLWSLINPRRWFGPRKLAAIVLPTAPTESCMEEQESPIVEQLLQTRNICDSSSYYETPKSRNSPLRSGSASPQNTHYSATAEVTDGKEPKLHELSDGDCSSDDDEEARLANTKFNTPPNINGPSNLRRTSLVLKKRKLSESSDEEASTSAKRIKRSTPKKSIISPDSKSSETMEIVSHEAIRDPTRINRKKSLVMKKEVKDKGEKESDTPTSSRNVVEIRKRISIKKEPYTPSKGDPSHSDDKGALFMADDSSVSNHKAKNASPTPKKSLFQNPDERQASFVIPSALAMPVNKRMAKESTASLSIRPHRACRALSISPSRSNTHKVTPSRTTSKATPKRVGTTGKRGRPPKKNNTIVIKDI